MKDPEIENDKPGESGEFIPPEMPPYPVDYDSVLQTLAPYYRQERPLDFFFEMYVVYVLGELPPETVIALKDFSEKHPTFFADCGGDWLAYVVKHCKLSDTIEIAIWDLWIRNAATAKRVGWDFHPWHYAQDFAENYFIDDSRIDVWPGNALEGARKRIEEYKNRPSFHPRCAAS